MTITTTKLNQSLLAFLSEVEKYSPYTLPAFECMYFLGCRAIEAREKKRWSIVDNSFVLLNASKRNNQRIFLIEDVPLSFLHYFKSDDIPENHLSYARLNYVFNKFFIYSQLFIGQKQSKLHLFRHNYTKGLIDKGFSNEEIKIKLGEKNQSSADAYINSVFSKVPYIIER